MKNENIDINSMKNLKYSEEELKDVSKFIDEYIPNHSTKDTITNYETVISPKIDRLCMNIPNFVINSAIFDLVYKIFQKLIDKKDDKKYEIKESENTQPINLYQDMFMRFKYLLEWCMFYYEQTYMCD